MRKFGIGLCAITFLVSHVAFGLQGKFGLSPDNSLSLVESVLNGAEKKLLINIYEFNNERIAEKLIARIKSGVSVKLIIEGEPVSSIDQNGVKILERIRDAISEANKRDTEKSSFFIMSNKVNPSVKRRYTVNHAKYIIADDETVLVSSENFSDHGHPVTGQPGNRGWEAVVQSKVLANKLAKLFEEDTDTSHKDVVLVGAKDDIKPMLKVKYGNEFESESEVSSDIPNFSVGTGDIAKVELISSPKSMEPLLKFLKTAKKQIEVEYMSLRLQWKESNEKIVSPLVKSLINAARRGVKVRVLLNDESVFERRKDTEEKDSGNEIVVKYLDDIARCHDLEIDAKIVDTKKVGITYIHNKGILVDSDKSLISSINGTQNSIQNNREIALLLQSTAANDYYRKAFDFDWVRTPDEGPSNRPCPELP